MLDIKFIRENSKLVREKARQKGYVVNIEKLLRVDEDRRRLIEEVDNLRAKRREASEKRDEAAGAKIKDSLKSKEDQLEKENEQFYQLIREVPNLAKDDVPVGRDENDNVVLREVGDKPNFDFKPKDHLELAFALDLIDVERAVKVAGSRFVFLKNELVILELALVRYTFDFLGAEGFIPIIPPALVNQKSIAGLGYPEYQIGEGYKVDEVYLIGTAEHSIVPMHMDEVFGHKDLPKRYAGFSPAFRREAGSYGKDTKGIFRVHQFDKVEMVSYVLPQDEDKEHQYLLSLEERMVGDLGLAYRVINICTGELGFPTARKFDIEIWMPPQNKYRETHSASTTGDFQARRFNIKYKNGDKSEYVYILNATAFAIGRTIIAILENYQQKDGSIAIPKVLQKYCGFSKIPRGS